jgi:hypothetical protein
VSGNTLGYDSSMVLGSDSGKESCIVSDKGPGKHPGKNSCKEVGQDKACKTRRLHCFGVNSS